MIGYCRDEIKDPSGVDLTNSRFYLDLGENEAERKFEVGILIAERKKWGPEIYRALQRALGNRRGASKKQAVPMEFTDSVKEIREM
ncbi:hypothetical protein ANCCAN_19387 [Ancylostoma caninum]|uniref:Uncharacterized protein n=1 Tax=Ancylostoma caninum TaxID=29170 RepID=A0A368FVF5_ANCCA|nr:hypothetical protein ANCCAN_19387 [Ancylostoma caninum]